MIAPLAPLASPDEVLARAAEAVPYLGVMSRDEAVEAIDLLWERGRERQTVRTRGSGWRRGQPRCETCHSFKSTPGSACGVCGYEPGRGFREVTY